MTSQITKLILMAVFTANLSGCGTWTEYYVSKEVSAERLISGKYIDGVNFYIFPHNRYELSGTFAPAYIPLVPLEGGGFNSYYYYDELGKYTKTKKGDPDYFIVEFIVDPHGKDFSVVIDSLSIVRENGSIVKPEQWHSSEAWVTPSKRNSGKELKQNEIACSHLQSFEEMKTIKLGEKKDIFSPTCILLRYPISPIYPGEKFSFLIKEVLFNNQSTSSIRVEFKGEKIKSFSGYRLGP